MTALPRTAWVTGGAEQTAVESMSVLCMGVTFSFPLGPLS